MFARTAHRSRTALAAAALAALSLVAACGQSGSSQEADGAPTRGGTLSIAFPNEPQSLDPAFSVQISSDRDILNQLYDSLLRMDADGNLQPALAQEWETSPDGRTVTFKLRDGVTFHDGTPFDAAAAAANLTRVIDPAVAAPKAATLKKVTGVTAPDPTTLVVQLSAPDPVLLTQLAHESGMMVSPTALEASGEEFGRQPVGTGPFRFIEWRSGVQLQTERNPTYWRTAEDGQPLPRLDGVTTKFITDEQVSLAELRTGGVQLVFNLPPSYFSQVESDSQLVSEDVGRRRSYYVTLNTTRAPFDNAQVREAFALAVDREQIGQVTAAGEFEIAPSFATRGDFFFDEGINTPAMDLDRSRELLAQAGYPDGLDVSILLRRRQPDPQIGELLQSQLAKAGFRVSVEPAEQQSLVERLRGQDFDAGVLVIDVPRIDPSLTFDPYFASTGASNWSGFNDPMLDQLLATAAAAPDQEQRAEPYSQVQQRIIDQNYWVFLHQPRAPIIHRAELQGLTYDVDKQWRLDEAYLTG